MNKESNEQIKQSDKKNGVNLESKTYSIIKFKVRNYGNEALYKQNTRTLNNIGGYKNQQDDNQKSV